VKPAAFAYRAPENVEEALALLEANHGAKLLAGGQSLVPVLNFRLASPPLLVDLNRIGGLVGIREEPDGTLAIGAMTRHRAVEKSALVRRANPLLWTAMPHIAHAQIRNRGTIGGSLAHADPAAELPAVCLACDAELVIQSRRGTRRVATTDFFVGFFSTALDPAEVLLAVRFPAWPAERRAGFVEVSRRHGDFAIVGVALTVDLKGGRCQRARIALFGAEDSPRLVNSDVLLDRPLEPRLFAEAARTIAAGANPRADHHASAEYRRELIEVLTHRALEQAIAT
jgi:carbon-monoxide dehydrogenase medium subunit